MSLKVFTNTSLLSRSLKFSYLKFLTYFLYFLLDTYPSEQDYLELKYGADIFTFYTHGQYNCLQNQSCGVIVTDGGRATEWVHTTLKDKVVVGLLCPVSSFHLS